MGRASTRGHRHGIPTSASWLRQTSPAQSNPVGMLALTKKFRSGIFALISMSRGEPTHLSLPGRDASTLGHRPLRLSKKRQWFPKNCNRVFVNNEVKIFSARRRGIPHPPNSSMSCVLAFIFHRWGPAPFCFGTLSFAGGGLLRLVATAARLPGQANV